MRAYMKLNTQRLDIFTSEVQLIGVIVSLDRNFTRN
jgi:hypothetical protein